MDGSAYIYNENNEYPSSQMPLAQQTGHDKYQTDTQFHEQFPRGRRGYGNRGRGRGARFPNRARARGGTGRPFERHASNRDGNFGESDVVPIRRKHENGPEISDIGKKLQALAASSIDDIKNEETTQSHDDELETVKDVDDKNEIAKTKTESIDSAQQKEDSSSSFIGPMIPSDVEKLTHTLGNKIKKEEKKKIREEKEKEEKEKKKDEDSDSDEDTSRCQICNVDFDKPEAYFKHTRGLMHTQRVMALESAEKSGEGKSTEEIKKDSSLFSQKPKQVWNDPPPIQAPPFSTYDRDLDPIAERFDLDLDSAQGDGKPIQKKKRVPVRQRDLHPEDIARSTHVREFKCEICDVRASSAVTFKTHLEGRNHKNNTARAIKIRKGKLEGVPGRYYEVQWIAKENRETSGTGPIISEKTVLDALYSKLMSELDEVEDPLIGLQYVTEYSREDPKVQPRYVCNLCECKCEGKTVLAHIVGLKHRLHYMKEHYPDFYQHIRQYEGRKSEHVTMAENYAQMIEMQEGRQSVKAKLEIDVFNHIAGQQIELQKQEFWKARYWHKLNAVPVASRNRDKFTLREPHFLDVKPFIFSLEKVSEANVERNYYIPGNMRSTGAAPTKSHVPSLLDFEFDEPPKKDASYFPEGPRKGGFERIDARHPHEASDIDLPFHFSGTKIEYVQKRRGDMPPRGKANLPKSFRGREMYSDREQRPEYNDYPHPEDLFTRREGYPEADQPHLHGNEWHSDEAMSSHRGRGMNRGRGYFPPDERNPQFNRGKPPSRGRDMPRRGAEHGAQDRDMYSQYDDGYPRENRYPEPDAAPFDDYSQPYGRGRGRGGPMGRRGRGDEYGRDSELEREYESQRMQHSQGQYDRGMYPDPAGEMNLKRGNHPHIRDPPRTPPRKEATQPQLPDQQPSSEGDEQPISGQDAAKNFTDMLGALSGSLIGNEDDAKMALHVSNALTQALLSYRIKSAPKQIQNQLVGPDPGQGGDAGMKDALQAQQTLLSQMGGASHGQHPMHEQAQYMQHESYTRPQHPEVRGNTNAPVKKKNKKGPQPENAVPNKAYIQNLEKIKEQLTVSRQQLMEHQHMNVHPASGTEEKKKMGKRAQPSASEMGPMNQQKVYGQQQQYMHQQNYTMDPQYAAMYQYYNQGQEMIGPSGQKKAKMGTNQLPTMVPYPSYPAYPMGAMNPPLPAVPPPSEPKPPPPPPGGM